MALRPVDLVEVDHIGLQATQAAFARGNDVRRCHALAFAHPGHATRRASHLGGQHQLLAGTGVLGKPVADDGFCRAKSLGPCGHRIHLGRVDEVDAARQRVAEDGVGICLVDLLAKRHGAQADGGHAQIALTQCDVLHAVQTPKAGATCGAGNAQGKKKHRGKSPPAAADIVQAIAPGCRRWALSAPLQ